MKDMILNKEQRLFVLNLGNHYTCLGFDVLDKRARKLADELGEEWNERKGTKKAFRHYRALQDIARRKNRATGWKSATELHPQLIGLEGRRVEVKDADGEIYRFQVGRSTGWIPCHLQLHNCAAHGGPSVDSRQFEYVHIIK